MEIDFIIKIAAVGIIVAILCQILSRSGRDEYALLTALAGIVVILMMLLPRLTELYSAVQSAFDF